VKFKLTYRENNGVTMVLLSDIGSSFDKALTFTGGASKKHMEELFGKIVESVRRKGL
jgi:hypothetical protein